MSGKTIFLIGANSVAAQDTIALLKTTNTVITGGRRGCDVYCDVTKTVTIPSGTDIVVNFAASFGGESNEQIVAALHTNVLGILEVCSAAKRAGVQHIVNISSIFAVVDETSFSYSIYALTKRQADELAVYYCKLYDIPLTILRPSRLYGDRDDFQEHQPFLYQIIDKAQAGADITLYGRGNGSRNYLHSADLAEIIERTVERRAEGIYSCTHTKAVTYLQIAHAAQRAFNKGGTIRLMENKPDAPSDIFPADWSLYERIEYRPQISIEAGIERIKQKRESEGS